MTCLITGCALTFENEAKSVWGDLHRIGDAYVFNAVLIDGEARWQYGPDAACPNVMKQLVVSSRCPPDGIFERRGVIVVHHDWAELNRAAQDYLEGAPR